MTKTPKGKTEVGVLLFENFETLDVFGPVEILGRLKELYQVKFYSQAGGLVVNEHGVRIDTNKLSEIAGGTGILLVPGGIGTRKEMENKNLVDPLRQIAQLSQYVLTVCTGSALLAKTGLLDNRVATSNKRVFDWVVTTAESVRWNRNARWTVDGKYYTSSGVSAGMDMILGFLADRHGLEFARTVAFQIEFSWQEDKNKDEFARQ